MAFIDFHLFPDTGPAATSPFRSGDAQPASEAILSAIERQVLSLAQGDAVSSLRPASVIDRIVFALFGVKRPNRLADARLEALRRLAVVAQRADPLRIAREMPRFLASGYDLRHANAVLNLTAS